MLTIGVTPLLRAAKALDAPAIKLLLAHGALVNLAEYSRHHSHHGRRRAWVLWMQTLAASTPLPMFSRRSLASLELLLAAGGEINAADGRGQTPLHGAAFWGWNDVVQFLVDHHANLNAEGFEGQDADRFRHGPRGRQ